MATPKHDLNFLELLQGFRRGELLGECDRKLSELVGAIHETGGKGEITIKLKLDTNKAGQIECNPAVQVKKPSRALGTGIYFATDEGRLSRRDPNQLDIEDEIERRRALDN